MCGSIGVGLDPEDEASRGVVQRALRSIDPAAGRDERDTKIRARRRKALLEEAFIGDAIPSKGLIPGFDTHDGIPSGIRMGFKVPVDDLETLCEKIVRGLTYVVAGEFIEPPYVVDMQMLQADAIPQFERMIEKFATEHSRGPGIQVRRAVPHDDPRMAVLGITIWGRLRLSAFVMPHE